MLNGYTELVGLMAYPIRHSHSPAMQNEAFRMAGINCVQLAFEVDNSTLKDAVQAIRALKLRGSNVSMPNKTVVGQYLDQLSPEAQEQAILQENLLLLKESPLSFENLCCRAASYQYGAFSYASIHFATPPFLILC